jgi:hypothetical protein
MKSFTSPRAIFPANKNKIEINKSSETLLLWILEKNLFISKQQQQKRESIERMRSGSSSLLRAPFTRRKKKIATYATLSSIEMEKKRRQVRADI